MRGDPHGGVVDPRWPLNPLRVDPRASGTRGRERGPKQRTYVRARAGAAHARTHTRAEGDSFHFSAEVFFLSRGRAQGLRGDPRRPMTCEIHLGS